MKSNTFGVIFRTFPSPTEVHFHIDFKLEWDSLILEIKNNFEYFYYHYKNKLHNEYGPAIITECEWIKNGLIPIYWLNGKSFTEEQWELAVHRLKYSDKIEKILYE